MLNLRLEDLMQITVLDVSRSVQMWKDSISLTPSLQSACVTYYINELLWPWLWNGGSLQVQNADFTTHKAEFQAEDPHIIAYDCLHVIMWHTCTAYISGN
jgi:hypothetical protein